jgi:glucose/arabinose dehydrogenase
LIVLATILLLFSTIAAGSNAFGDNESSPVTHLRDVVLPAGYELSVFAHGLPYPTGITLSPDGQVFVSEAGIAGFPGQVVQLHGDGSESVIATGFKPPVTGVMWHDGWLYVSQTGAITRIRPDGSNRQDIITGLPALGDHNTNMVVFGPNGKLYFSQGSATNSGVPGLDNTWIVAHPSFHDFPCQDIHLTNAAYITPNILTSDPTDFATTGAYSAFGTSNTFVAGNVKCNGAILEANPDGTNLRVVAWGFRNPFGIGFSPDGHLFVTNNEYDARSTSFRALAAAQVTGDRPVTHANDTFWMVPDSFLSSSSGPAWFGWPDFWAGESVSSMAHAADASTAQMMLALTGAKSLIPPQLLTDETHQALLGWNEGVAPKPFAIFADHVSSDKFDFSTSSRFGFVGNGFVTETGSLPPITGATSLTGYDVVMVDNQTHTVSTFLANKSRLPAFFTGESGINKPIDLRFSSDGRQMFIVDLGVFPPPSTQQISPTGAVYVVTHRDSNEDTLAVSGTATPKQLGAVGFIVGFISRILQTVAPLARFTVSLGAAAVGVALLIAARRTSIATTGTSG